MKLSKKLTNPNQARNRGQDRLTRIDANLSNPTGLEKLRLAERSTPGLDAEAGEGIVDDLRQIIEIAEDEREHADIERFLDQPRDYVLRRAPSPRTVRPT